MMKKTRAEVVARETMDHLLSMGVGVTERIELSAAR